MMKNYLALYCLVASLGTALAQCPWQQDLPDFQSSCLCAYNLRRELSVQCDMVDFTKLVHALDHYCRNIPLDLLYINNSTVLALKDSIFKNLQIHTIQISGCNIKNVAPGAFIGQEEVLKNLNLQENDLVEVPVESLRQLKILALLDLSHNRITNIPDGAFKTLKKLTSLKLSDNNVTLAPGSLQGLENSLKNLNLKGTNQKNIPVAVRGLKNLAFLDISQNNLRDLPGSDGKDFEGLTSLTALNLERNLLQSIEEHAFEGIKTSLSSLSLLNNLIPEFPTEAISKLLELRVLDIGFNLLTELPNDAFKANPSITLLAVDGNPLSTVPFAALSHLNHTLRGLSLGGRFLHCDCRVKWIIDWIHNADLQVTSRERNPQFCGSPPRFRDRGFYSIQPEELTCSEGIGVATVVNPNEEILLDSGTFIPVSSSTSTTPPPETSTRKLTTTTTTKITAKTFKTTTTTEAQMPNTFSTAVSTTSHQVRHTNPTSTTTSPSWKLNIQHRPSLVMGLPSRKTSESLDVMVKSAHRQDNSVIIQWGSNTANILGFRVVYRLFGDKTFKQGPPLEASEREFKIKNVPAQECIVVCVISLEEINVTPDTVPYSQCREVRTVTASTSNMDKITIAASAAICGTIIIAVIVFVATSRRRSRKMHDLQKQKLPNCGHPITGLPINCCTSPTTSPGGPMSSFATLNAYNPHKQEWDQMSAYSSHSMQRPQIYSMDQPSSLQNGMCTNFGSKGNIIRSMADGQSQHSFSNSSSRYLTGFSTNLVTQDFRQSRQSLAMQSDRMSRKSHPASHHAMTHSTTSSTRRTRPRSRSREQHRSGSHYSTAGSIHTLNNYCENPENNWTDHDMDIYMARNPTTHGGLVPL